MKCELVEQFTRPKHSPGVNWGGVIVVLVKRGTKELWKTPGSTISYSSICKEYIPGSVLLVPDGEGYWSGRNYECETIQEGGRVSRKTFTAHGATINEFFGCDVADKIDVKKTLIID